MKKYFISYNFVMSDQRSGSGCTVLTSERSITSMDDIRSVINFIKENEKSLENAELSIVSINKL